MRTPFCVVNYSITCIGMLCDYLRYIFGASTYAYNVYVNFAIAIYSKIDESISSGADLQVLVYCE